MSEAELRIQISAEADQATSEIARLQSQIQGLTRAGNNMALGEQMQRTGQQITQVGQGIFGVMKQIGGAVIESASKYETAMASFSRISGVTGSELDGLGKEFIGLSKTIPKSIPDLITIGEEASKIGVAKDGIIDMTRLVSQMSVAFDISAGDTGEAVGKISANFGMLEKGIPNMKRLETFGNVVNNLGDSLAAGESGIIEFTKRTAGLYKTAGMTENELAVFGATMQDVGIVPETAARAFEKFATVLARGKNNTANAKEGFEMLGLSVTDMQKQMLSGNGTEAMVQLFDAIKKGGAEAQIATEMMFGDFGGEAVRTANSANGVAKSFEIMKKAMSGEGTTLDGGLATMSQTFEAQMVLMQNSFDQLGIALGQSGVLEAITSIVQGITGLVSGLSQASPAVLQFAVGFGLIATAIGLILIPLGSLITIIGTITTLMASGVFAGLAATIAGWGSAFLAFGMSVMTAVAPFMLLGVLIVGAVAAFMMLVAYIQQVIAAFMEFGIVSGIVMVAASLITTALQIIVGVFTGLIAAVVGFGAALVLAFASGVAAIVGGGLKILAAIASWIEGLMGFPPVVSSCLNNAANIVLGFVGVFRSAGAALMQALADGVMSAIGSVTSAVQGAMESVRSMLPFSDAKEGPLSDLTYSGSSIPRTLAEGVRKNQGAVAKAMSRIPIPNLQVPTMQLAMDTSPSLGLTGESSGTNRTPNFYEGNQGERRTPDFGQRIFNDKLYPHTPTVQPPQPYPTKTPDWNTNPNNYPTKTPDWNTPNNFPTKTPDWNPNPNNYPTKTPDWNPNPDNKFPTKIHSTPQQPEAPFPRIIDVGGAWGGGQNNTPPPPAIDMRDAWGKGGNLPQPTATPTPPAKPTLPAIPPTWGKNIPKGSGKALPPPPDVVMPPQPTQSAPQPTTTQKTLPNIINEVKSNPIVKILSEVVPIIKNVPPSIPKIEPLYPRRNPVPQEQSSGGGGGGFLPRILSEVTKAIPSVIGGGGIDLFGFGKKIIEGFGGMQSSQPTPPQVMPNCTGVPMPNTPTNQGQNGLLTPISNSSVTNQSSTENTNASTTNNSPINVTINLNGGGQDTNFVEMLRKEGAEIARIVEGAIGRRDRTKYAR